VEQLTTNAYDDLSPAWDPGARTVAFVSRKAGERRLKVLDWETREVKTVLASERHLDHPSWRPNGRALWVTRGSSREFDGYFNDLEIFEIFLPAGTDRPLSSAGPPRVVPAGNGR
jgi:Tol biopolymer transport system component